MNSQYLLLLVRIPPHHWRIARRSRFQAAQNVRFRLQTVRRNTEIVNGSERKLYLSWYPWEAWWSIWCPGRGRRCWRKVDDGNSEIKSESAICAWLVRASIRPRDTLTSTGSFR
jgi:hypothetical protein